ncbi:MAG: major capsid protein [Microvirus sp.]|nr:MAG: major capsid protein [Microvirus sp.]
MGKKFTQPSSSEVQQHFAKVPSAEIERSTFDRSHGLKTTFDHGRLVPVYIDEILPGDTFEMRSTAFGRLATPLKPIMDNIFIDTHFFFVPMRLLWDNWQKFCGERYNFNDPFPNLKIPQTTLSLTQGVTKLSFYMGIPRNGNLEALGGTVTVSALPFRAYALIYNEWYRDENLSAVYGDGSGGYINTGDGPDDWTSPLLAVRNKRKDYFSSCLPWPQKGDPVFIPIATSASIESNGLPVEWTDGTTVSTMRATTPGTTGQTYSPTTAQANSVPVHFGPETGLFADLTNATAITINDLRVAFQIQRLLERDARGGTRYIELVLSHFGVTSDDARMQRPEYLGGGTAMLNFNPIASTQQTPEVPQANLAATGTFNQQAGFTKSFTEHGYIIGIVSTRADKTYQNGVERFWLRESRYNFYWPALSHLGEQAVVNKEIYANGTATDDEAWGYQERYAEYRYKPSRITGKFASTLNTGSLDFWHLAEDYDAKPGLGADWIGENNTPIDRILAVPGEPHYLLDMWFSLKCTRPMPVYSVPGLIDHF